MNIIIKTPLNPYQKEILKVIINNPFINRIDDEIGLKGLVDWTFNEARIKNNKYFKKEEIKEVIRILANESVFTLKSYGSRILLRSTSKYKQLKSSINHTQTNANSIFKSTLHTTKSNEPPILKIKKSVKNNEIKYIQYLEYMNFKVNAYSGSNKDLTLITPNFFSLLCNILHDPLSDWHTRIMISSGLSYLVLENDIIPDNLDNGYIDDLYIITYILQKIKNQIDPNLIENNWDFDDDILELIDEVIEKSKEVVSEVDIDIIHHVGLGLFENANLEEYSGKYPIRIANTIEQKREYLAFLVYLYKKLTHIENPLINRIDVESTIKNLSDYAEIQRLIALLSAFPEKQKNGKINHIASRKELEECFSENLNFFGIILKRSRQFENTKNDHIKYSPYFFKLLCNILNDHRTPWYTKIMINCALAYFVLDKKYTSYHVYNYNDDLFLMGYVLKEIKNGIDPDLIAENWKYQTNIFEIIDSIYSKAYEIVKSDACNILRIVGLYKFKTLKLDDDSPEYRQRYKKLSQERKELKSEVIFLIEKIFGENFQYTSFDAIKDFMLKNGDSNEIMQLIELSKLYHEIEGVPSNRDCDVGCEDEEESILRDIRIGALFKEQG